MSLPPGTDFGKSARGYGGARIESRITRRPLTYVSEILVFITRHLHFTHLFIVLNITLHLKQLFLNNFYILLLGARVLSFIPNDFQ